MKKTKIANGGGVRNLETETVHLEVKSLGPATPLATAPNAPPTHTHTHPASFSGACPRRGSVSLRPPRAASWASLPERGPSASFLGLSLTSPSLYTRHGTLNRMGGERVPIPYTEDMEMQLEGDS